MGACRWADGKRPVHAGYRPTNLLKCFRSFVGRQVVTVHGVQLLGSNGHGRRPWALQRLAKFSIRQCATSGVSKATGTACAGFSVLHACQGHLFYVAATLGVACARSSSTRLATVLLEAVAHTNTWSVA
ncbi:UNVERIFIED_CONTAM: hypothetical protein Sangu_2915800 [Sesamum angustifolium]|uniref:Uncharacterized protein n=1 Tax=Sesamum angustifolium TaxID=2727405 RepID=A0AAW2ILQ0_9LAMI